MAQAPARGTRTRRLALAAWAAVITCSGWAALSGASGPGKALLATVLLLPLLLPLSGLVRGTRRSYAWATLCLVPGLVYGTVESVANPAVRGPAALVLFASLLGFVALVAHLRATRESAA